MPVYLWKRGIGFICPYKLVKTLYRDIILNDKPSFERNTLICNTTSTYSHIKISFSMCLPGAD